MTIPFHYVCTGCGKSGVKLWRESASFSFQTLCVTCTCDAAGIPVQEIAADGTHPNPLSGRPTDQIGIFVPACPDGQGDYYGYTSVPGSVYRWWRALPLT